MFYICTDVVLLKGSFVVARQCLRPVDTMFESNPATLAYQMSVTDHFSSWLWFASHKTQQECLAYLGLFHLKGILPA